MASRRRRWLCVPVSCLVLSLAIAITGCGSVPAAVTVKSISLAPASANIAAGATQQFTATATYSDGSTANISSTATWTVATPAVATVTSSGLTTGAAAGSAMVTASLSGIIGSASLTVMASTVTLASISVAPSSVSIAAGATQQFTATATYSDGSTANVSSTATWTVATPVVATVNSSGLATGITAGSTAVTASLSGITGSASFTVTGPTITLSSISVTPSSASVAVGSTQQFTATATYSNGSTANVSSTAIWTAATPAVATVASSGLATGITTGSTAVTASLGGITGSASLAVTSTVAGITNVAMWHYDAQRTGLNPTEISLSPANVTPQTFGKLFSYLLDGYEYGQPLLMSNLVINGITRNVVFAATENDSVYAFDADNYNNGTPLWQVSLLQPGETPILDGPIQPVEGVTSTPVIDTTSNTMYVVSVQTLTSTGASTFRLNALNILTGAQTTGSPVTIQASVPGTNSDSINGVVSLTVSCVQRAALLVSNGTVYIGFGGCHSGWLLAYNELTLAQTGVFNASPNLNGEGLYASAGGVWMGGGGPAADDSGNIYITTGNGPWDGLTAWSDSVLKFSSDGKLQMLDYFTPDDYRYMNCHDADLASGGLLLIPGSTEALAGGKTGVLYLVNETDLGHEQDNDAGATQVVPGVLIDQDFLPYSSSCTDPPPFPPLTWTTNINSYEFFSTPSYFNGSVYVGLTPTSTAIPVGIVQFQYSGTLTAALTSLPAMQQGSNGATAFISANGTANGILWMIDHGDPLQNQYPPVGVPPTTAILRAYDALDLTTELYDSGINAGDAPGYGIKFTSPIVANGKVYIGTGHDLTTVPNPRGELDVYGSLP
ncbi:MAG: Ig-like domain-containing protein [Candidatus Sulfotelmatobacter sp.]